MFAVRQQDEAGRTRCDYRHHTQMFSVRNPDRAKRIVFAIYMAVIIWLTIISRKPTGKHRLVLDLFWSYRALFAGESNGVSETIQNINNVLAFIPFGFLFPKKSIRLIGVVLFAALTSIAIETIQYVFTLGWCELDDVICNTLGAFVGYGIWKIKKKCGEGHAT